MHYGECIVIDKVLYVQLDYPRRFFVCQTTADIDIPSLRVETMADVIYSKNYGDGVLVLLKYESKNKKRHSTVENSLLVFEKQWMDNRAGAAAALFVNVRHCELCWGW